MVENIIRLLLLLAGALLCYISIRIAFAAIFRSWFSAKQYHQTQEKQETQERDNDIR